MFTKQISIVSFVFFCSVFRLTIFLVSLIGLSVARPAEDDYADYDNAEAPPSPKKPIGRPLTSRRNPLAGRSNAKSATSTTTTTEASKVK